LEGSRTSESSERLLFRVLTLAGKVSAVDRTLCSRKLRSRRCEYLLVEDDPLIREFVVEALREEGFHVVHGAAIAAAGIPRAATQATAKLIGNSAPCRTT
jgi:hypothetical protein